MKKYRVLIIRNAYQQDTGGAEQYAFNLALALKRAGHQPVVVTKHKFIHEKCKAEGIKFVQGIWHESQEWSKRYYLRYWLMPLWYCWLIIRYRISIVHPQSRDDCVFATNAARLLRRPVVWTDHADLKYVMDRVNHPHPRMQAWILRAAKRINKILCVSNAERASIIGVAPELESLLAVVHNGVFPPQNLQPMPKGEDVIIGTNARLVEAKGVGELMDAFALTKQSFEHTKLWLVGGFSNNKELYEERARKLGIYEDVKFIGYVPNPNDYLASMDIFVHASYHEAFSLAIIEACMLAKPIIATNVGGTSEIIDNTTGILVPPKDSQALAEALAAVINDPALRSKLGLAAAKRAKADFDFQKIVEQQIIPVYERSRG